MRSLKRTILAAALLISFSAAGATLGNDVSAASLQAAEPAGPVSNTGRDYRIALINAENSRGPVIHKPLKEEKGTPVSRSGKVTDSKEDSTYREDAPSLRHHDKEESQNTVSTASIKTITTGDTALTSTVSAALIKTKTPAGADPAAVTMIGATENRPLCSRKMPDSDKAMIHWHRLIA